MEQKAKTEYEYLPFSEEAAKAGEVVVYFFNKESYVVEWLAIDDMINSNAIRMQNGELKLVSSQVLRIRREVEPIEIVCYVYRTVNGAIIIRNREYESLKLLYTFNHTVKISK